MENVGVVSVIIPVHNVENYVHNIFEFMNSQEYKKWELIFINDHSTDNTIREVNREKQGIIQRVIIKDNSGIGVSAARNTGIKSSLGEYIAFVDADDKIKTNYLRVLVENIIDTKSDIVMCSYVEVLNGSTKVKLLPWNGLIKSSNDIRNKIIPRLVFPRKNEKQVWLPVWRTLIKANFLRKSNILFNEKLSQAEDFMFLFELLLNSKSVSFIRNSMPYYYIRRYNSALNSFIENNLEHQDINHSLLVECLNHYGIYEKLKIRYLSNKASMYSIAISNATRINNRVETLNEIRNVRAHYVKDRKLNTFPISHLYNRVSVKMGLYLLKMNCIHILELIYSTKEKHRRGKLN